MGNPYGAKFLFIDFATNGLAIYLTIYSSKLNLIAASHRNFILILCPVRGYQFVAKKRKRSYCPVGGTPYPSNNS